MKSTFAILSLFATALAAPSSIISKSVAPPTRLDPILSQYNVWTGAVTYSTGKGLVQKTNGREPDITTLLTFTFPLSTDGYNCEIRFPLEGCSTASGSQKAQIFSSLRPASESSDSWPSGNLRDLHLGDVFFDAPGGAHWEETYGIYATGKFPCPAGYQLGAEIVGRWDEVEIAWTQSHTAGPFVKVTPM